MKIDLLLLQLSVVFLPGIVWALLDGRYAAKTRPSTWEFVLRAFLFGLACYAMEFMLFLAIGWPFRLIDLAAAGSEQVIDRAILYEILGALAISMLTSIAWLYFENYKVLARFLQAIRATRKFGDEDVWDFTFNSSDISVEYVHFRDFQTSCVFAGWVNSFSETGRLREIVLLDVIVYDFDARELYRAPRIYLARSPENVHIEFPYAPSPGVVT